MPRCCTRMYDCVHGSLSLLLDVVQWQLRSDGTCSEVRNNRLLSTAFYSQP